MSEQKQVSNKFLWASFLPAIAYWYLEANYDLKTALIGGLILASLEMSLEWILTKHVHTISKLNFYLILILGGIAFVADEGIWFKLQPSFTGVLMGTYMLFRYYRGDSLMIQMMKEMNNKNLPDKIILFLEKNMSFFMFGYGLFMLPVAIYLSTEEWLFFKTAGFYIAILVFFIVQLLFLKIRGHHD
jgi:intracellular septation protein